MEYGLEEPIAHELSGDTQIDQVLSYTYPEFMEQLWWGNNGYASEWRNAIGGYLDENVYAGEQRKKGELFDGDIQRFRSASGIDNIGKVLIWKPLLKDGQTWEDKIKENLYVLGYLRVEDWKGRFTLPNIKGEDAFNNKEIQRVFLSLNPARRERGFPEQKIKPNYFGPTISFMNWDSNPLRGVRLWKI